MERSQSPHRKRVSTRSASTSTDPAYWLKRRFAGAPGRFESSDFDTSSIGVICRCSCVFPYFRFVLLFVDIRYLPFSRAAPYWDIMML